MRLSRWLLGVILFGCAAITRAADPAITFIETKEQLTIQADGKEIATYVFKHKELTRPGFLNVRSLHGTPVTRPFPARVPEDVTPGHKGDDGIDHRLLHPGLWLSFGDINGHDYWRQKARVELEQLMVEPKGERPRSFAVRNRYLSSDGKTPVCIENTRFTVLPTTSGWWLIWEATFTNDRELTFGVQEEVGLGVRVASPLRVTGGKGTIRNSSGDRNGVGTWGKPTDWLDYAGPLGMRHVGILVASDPANGRSCWAHSRDYGVMVLNPFAKPDKGSKPTVIQKGETLRLAFGVLIHDTPEKEPLDGKAAYQEFLTLRKKTR